MAIAIDASSPARITQNASSTAVTASFDPPISVLLIASASNASTGTAATISITNNSTALTWNLIALRNLSDSGGLDGACTLHWANLTAARTAMTVTATTSSTGVTQKLYVLTGVDTASVVGGSTEGSATTDPITTTGFTIAQTGSFGVVAASQFTGARAAFTSSDTTVDAGDTANFGGFIGYKTLGSVGGSATFNISAGGTPSTVNWVSAEIRALATNPVSGSLFVPRNQAVARSYFR